MNEKAYSYMDWPRIEAIVYAEEASPKDVMSPRLTPDGILIQGFFPGAEEAAVLVGNKEYPMEQEDEAGYFAAMIPGRKIPAYQFRVKTGGKTEVFYDAYAFPGMLTEEDEKAFVAGVYYNAYEKLGAHPVIKDGIEGTSFAVWAPNAVRVSVVGDFNHWDGRRLPMHRMPMSGIFELFVPGVQPGDIYKYEILVKGKGTHLKADPYANRAEQPRACGSVVAKVDDFVWNDQAWMADRKKYADRDQPVSIYETSLTKWKTAGELVDFCIRSWLYPCRTSSGYGIYGMDQTDGYSTSSYFAPTSRFGTPEDFQKLVDALHQKGIGVILDWTPAQFPRYEGGLENFDGTPLYELKDPAAAVHPYMGHAALQLRKPYGEGFPDLQCMLLDGSLSCGWASPGRCGRYAVSGFWPEGRRVAAEYVWF